MLLNAALLRGLSLRAQAAELVPRFVEDLVSPNPNPNPSSNPNPNPSPNPNLPRGVTSAFEL